MNREMTENNITNHSIEFELYNHLCYDGFVVLVGTIVGGRYQDGIWDYGSRSRAAGLFHAA